MGVEGEVGRRVAAILAALRSLVDDPLGSPWLLAAVVVFVIVVFGIGRR